MEREEEKGQQQTETCLHVKLHLGITIFPGGNRLPMVVQAQQMQQQGQKGAEENIVPLTTTPAPKGGGNDRQKTLPVHNVVDAHSVQNITMEEAIAGIARAMPIAMSHEELMARRLEKAANDLST
jgi:hypothetical protein